MFGTNPFGELAFGEDSTVVAPAETSPPSSSIIFVGPAPTISQGAAFSPTPANLTLFGATPSVNTARQIFPVSIALLFTGLAPSITQGTEIELKPISIAQFRLDFPEFADTTKYTDAQIGRQLTAAKGLLNEMAWDTEWGYGIELRTAHFLTIAARNAASVASGGVGGGVSGLLTSKSVDKVAAGYDVSATTYEGAGFWNTTSYGIEFYQLLMMFGAGVVQL